MIEVLRTKEFVFREVEEDADFSQLAAWIREDPGLDFFERYDSPDDLRKLFVEKRSDEPACCIVEHEGRSLGYVEFYPSRLWFRVHGDAPEESPWGMDVFVGNPADRNKGLGAQLVKQVALYLLRERDATRVVIDPEASNEQAIRCYERAGFQKRKFIPGSVTEDEVFEDTWMMEYGAE